MSQVFARPLFGSLLDHAKYLIEKKELDAAEGFQEGILTHFIVLTPSGRATGWFSPTFDVQKKGKTVTRRGRPTMLPTTPRSSGIKARLGWDDHRYVYVPGPHRDAFARRIEDIAALAAKGGKEHPLLDAVRRFYADGHVDTFYKTYGDELHADLEAMKLEPMSAGENADRFSFVLKGKEEEGVALVEVESLKEFLSDHLYQDDLPTGKCIITGEDGPLLRSSGLIKGVRGAQSSGARLISFTANVGLSFGLSREQAYPPYHVSVDSAIRALNYILIKGKTKIATDKLTVCHYTEGNPVFVDEILQPYPRARPDDEEGEEAEQDLQELLWSPKNGRANVFLSSRVTSIGLQPSGGRVALTLYDDSSTEALLKRIRGWHEDLYIPLSREEEFGRPLLPIFKIVGALEGYAKGKGALHPLVPARKADLTQQLYISAVFENEALPASLEQYLFVAINRLCAMRQVSDQRYVNRQRHMLAMIAKLILIRQYGRNNVSSNLDISDGEDVASCLGRMYALLVIVHEMTYPNRPGLLAAQMQSVIAYPQSFNGTKFFSLVYGRMRSSIPLERGVAHLAKKRWSMIAPLTSGLPARFSPAQKHEFLVGFEKERQLFYTPKQKPETEEVKSYAEA